MASSEVIKNSNLRELIGSIARLPEQVGASKTSSALLEQLKSLKAEAIKLTNRDPMLLLKLENAVKVASDKIDQIVSDNNNKDNVSPINTSHNLANNDFSVVDGLFQSITKFVADNPHLAAAAVIATQVAGHARASGGKVVVPTALAKEALHKVSKSDVDGLHKEFNKVVEATKKTNITDDKAKEQYSQKITENLMLLQTLVIIYDINQRYSSINDRNRNYDSGLQKLSYNQLSYDQARNGSVNIGTYYTTLLNNNYNSVMMMRGGVR
jgi:hypothetical protein